MAVSIPISANTTQVVQAFREIQTALERAGQTGKAFKDVDLSHPELQRFAADIQKVQQRLEELARVGRGETAAAVRSFYDGSGVNLFGAGGMLSGGLNARFPNQATAARVLQQTGGYVFQGTRWAPPPPPVPPAPGGPALPPPPPGQQYTNFGGGGGGGGGTFGTTLMGLLGGPVAGGIIMGSLALAGISGIKQILGQSIGLAQDEAYGNEALLRHADEGATDFDALRQSVRDSTKGLQINYQEAQKLSLAWTRLTNEALPAQIASGMRLSAGFGMAYGMDPGMAAQTLGRAQFLGVDADRFAIRVGEAAAAGRQSSQIEQVMESLLRWSETAARAMIGPSSSASFAAMYAGLNALGAADQIPGLRGVNAEQIIGQVNSSLMQGGKSGPASMALTYRAMQGLGVTDPYAMQYLLEGGMFGTPAQAGVGSSTTSVYDATMRELRAEYAGRPRYQLLNAMENHLGINMRQSDALLNMTPAALGYTEAALQRANVNLTDVNPTGLRDLGLIAGAAPEDLETWRAKLLTRHGAQAPSVDEAAMLRSATGDNLRQLMLQIVARRGSEATEGSETRQGMADLTNALTKLGQDFLKPLADLKSDVAAPLIGAMGDLGSILVDVYKAGTGDPLAKQRLLSLAAPGTSVRGGEGDLSQAEKRSRAAELVAFYQTPEGGGYTRAQAAGIVAQADAESGMLAHGASNAGHRGMFQWEPSRVAAIEAHAREAGWAHTTLDTMDYLDQARAKAWELSTLGPEAGAGRTLRGAGSAYAAGFNETVADQRPDAAQLRAVGRGQLAEKIFALPAPSPISSNTVVHITHDVVHHDSAGAVIGSDSLPSTTIYPPQPWGPERAGMSAPLKTPPPPRPPPAASSTMISPTAALGAPDSVVNGGIQLHGGGKMLPIPTDLPYSKPYPIPSRGADINLGADSSATKGAEQGGFANSPAADVLRNLGIMGSNRPQYKL